MKLYFTAGLGLASAMALSSVAFAQTPPAAAPAASGPAIAGVCVFSKEYAIGGSAVGQSVAARIKQLTSTVEAELKAEQSGLEAEKRTLDTQRTTMQQDQFEQRALQFNQRVTAFERKRQLRGQELQVTEGKQLQRIAQELEPIIKQVYAERNCGLMIDRNSLILANPAMDVTPLVVQRLNAKITTLGAFERERGDQQAAPRPAAAPAPAAAKPPVKK